MKNKEKTFEERVERIQFIVSSLEKEDISLADSIELYKEGILHIKECRKQLAEAKNIVELNTGAEIHTIESPSDLSDPINLNPKQTGQYDSDFPSDNPDDFPFSDNMDDVPF